MQHFHYVLLHTGSESDFDAGWRILRPLGQIAPQVEFVASMAGLETGLQRHTVAGQLWVWQEWTATPGSHNSCYVTWANSPALIIRLEWQSSLATLPF